MRTLKKIKSIRVVKPGSNPDVDSDIATYARDSVLQHCEDIYGRGSLANIITFQTLGAKAAFKVMCTIYEVPFAQANKIASLLPPPVEGVEVSLTEVFDTKHYRYPESRDFRDALSGDEWKHIIDGARAIEGRTRATGVHPCGVIMSSKPLDDVIPLQVRQKDGRVITQWDYEQCESLGYIKFDFLGLDTVDLIQNSIEYIMKNGKVAPNMVDIIHGTLDDKKTYELIGRGETNGIFQLSGDGVKDLLRKMKPTELMDIIATTALYRPGPMGMQSHIKYAERKNGKNLADYPVHPDFKNSPLEEILKKTHNLLVFQEQVLLVSREIAGMTLQEGDQLRKAMGKKQKDVMAKMMPVFVEGGINNGYSEAGMKELWNTIAVFAEYAFNLSHSVAYALMAYQSAYLKAHYPVEFMAALIAQNIGKKDKILSFLQETKRMKIKVGTPDINVSDIRVSPDYKNASKYDIVYGLSGVDAVSEDVSRIIVSERENNGEFTSIQDVINRCSKLGVNNKKIYENLTYAGAFDSFGFTRKSIIENIPALIGESKTQSSKGATLFDILGLEEEAITVDFSKIDEYSHLDKLNFESSVIGLALSGQPLENIGSLSGMRTNSIAKVMSSNKQVKARMIGSVSEINVKRLRNGGKSIAVTFDDESGSIVTFLNREIVKGIDKRAAQEKIAKNYQVGLTQVSNDLSQAVLSSEFVAMDDLETGQVYSFDLTFRPGYGDNSYAARISDIHKIELTDAGALPVRVRLNKAKNKTEKLDQVKLLTNLAKKHPGDVPIYVGIIGSDEENLDFNYANAITIMLADDADGIKSDGRTWPPPKQGNEVVVVKAPKTNYEKIEKLNYKPTKFMVDKSKELSREIEKNLGIENYDFGVFNFAILDD